MADVALGQQRRLEFPHDGGSVGRTGLTFLVLGPAGRFHPQIWGFQHSRGIWAPWGQSHVTHTG